MPLRQPPRTLSFCSSPPHESAMVKVQNDTSTTTPLPSYRTYDVRYPSIIVSVRRTFSQSISPSWLCHTLLFGTASNFDL
jgi:hypothetical protein